MGLSANMALPTLVRGTCTLFHAKGAIQRTLKGHCTEGIALVPSPTPSFLSLAVRLGLIIVLKATIGWVWDGNEATEVT